jgi:hypothetical protein
MRSSTRQPSLTPASESEVMNWNPVREPQRPDLPPKTIAATNGPKEETPSKPGLKQREG